ncbi:TRAP transporter small permease subunit [Chelativorans sp. AA-79]|uniref:TRAP transporter small permease subunit n=1 Tax=Chelativorans sp. AA-79 TaxID=3028735 RepID=UPI0023F70DE9|nr:TRAP transporter small permease subunit [Chelativorans sp. AA-79]WEX09311.1 TRAP transporter small permease subunit [Chelativorans sp. AA-79]
MSQTPEDQATGLRSFDTLSRSFDRVTAAMSVIGTAAILFIMVLITTDVVGRFFFGRPIAGVPEIVSMLILSIVFLQIANTLLRGKLTRADGLLTLLRSRAPKVGGVLDATMHFIGAGLVGVLVYAFYPLFVRSYGRNEMIGTVGQFLAPIWPTYLIVLIGASALLIAFALRGLAILLATFRSVSREAAR